jgi:hypothetical protein
VERWLLGGGIGGGWEGVRKGVRRSLGVGEDECGGFLHYQFN